MSSSASRTRPVDEASAELTVLCRLHSILAAVPARWISQLVLPAEVASIRPGAPEVVESAKVRHAAWDLGTLLGEAPTTGAYLLLRVPHRGKVLPIALQTGECLAVTPMPRSFALPPRAFERRTKAIARAFHGPRGSGVVIDAAQLWTGAELDASARALEVSP